LNNENFRIYHCGCKISPNPIKIKNMEIYNDLKADISKILLNFFETSEIKDTFNSILLGSILKLLSIENQDKVIHYFLDSLSKEIFNGLNLIKSFLSGEDELLELKSADVVAGDNSKIVDYFTSDLNSKMKESNIKIYVIGANEKTKQFEPISISKFNDDRIKTIVNSLKEKTQIKFIEVIKIPADGTKCLLLMVAKND